MSDAQDTLVLLEQLVPLIEDTSGR